MTSPELDLDALPIPRSREQNQERAFIAASRRKDRSLDARLESAIRASLLHKKRTGKSLYITKDVVEKEAMYEEVDERYQEKRICMLQVQNMKTEEQFNRQFLAALAVRENWGSSSSSSSSSPTASLSSASARSFSAPSASSAASHHHQPLWATSMTRRASVDDVRKMSLDLSSLRSSMSEGVQTGPLTSPMVMHQGYVMSPGYDTLSPSSQNQQPQWYSPQVPSYVQQAPWPQKWTGFQPQQQQQQQQHIIQDILQMRTHFPVRQFRDRFSSAPEISLHDLPANSLSMMSPTPAEASPPAQQPLQHSNVLRTRAVDGDAAFTTVSHGPSAKIQSTFDACPSTINTPQSAKLTGLEPVPGPQPDLEVLGQEDEGMLFSHDTLHPDFDRCRWFALGLGNGAETPERDLFRFDEFMASDDFTAVA